MKRLLMAMLTLISITAFASVDYQASNITGAWDSGKTVFLIQLQTEDTIKIYRCNRADYLANNHCTYNRLLIGNYNRNFDGFCLPWGGKSCPTGLQVSLQYSSEMLEILDPLNIYNSAGEVIQLKKL